MGYAFQKLKELFRDRGELKRQAQWTVRQGKSFLPQLVLIFLLNTLISAVTVGCTLLNKRLIDDAVARTGGFDVVCFVLMAALTIGNIMLGAGTSYISALLSERLRCRVRSACFDRFLHNRWQNASAFHSADVLTRLTSDINSVSSGFTQLIPGFLGAFVRMLMAFIVLCRYDGIIAVAALILGPACFFVGIAFNGVLRKYQLALSENESASRALMQESIEKIQVIKAFEQEEDTVRRYDEFCSTRISLSKKRARVSLLMRISMNSIFRSGYLLAFGRGIYRVSRGQITYGTMSVFLSLVSLVSGPIYSMGEMIPEIVSVLTAAGRIMELEDPEIEEKNSIEMDRERVGISFENVSFAYDDQNVLSDVSFTVKPGESVGIVGETGAGKTTVIKLLLALIYPQTGRVEFFDDDGRRAAVSPSTRSLISYVPQGNTLRSGTLGENLRSGRDDISDEAVWQALKTAAVDEFVSTLPEGLNTRIGENGLGLSEGQAQRIAIARALLREAPLLILDEASASLDMETERRIMCNLQTCGRKSTCLIITHRPSLLKLCSRSIEIAGGSVREIG